MRKEGDQVLAGELLFYQTFSELLYVHRQDLLLVKIGNILFKVVFSLVSSEQEPLSILPIKAIEDSPSKEAERYPDKETDREGGNNVPHLDIDRCSWLRSMDS